MIINNRLFLLPCIPSVKSTSNISLLPEYLMKIMIHFSCHLSCSCFYSPIWVHLSCPQWCSQRSAVYSNESHETKSVFWRGWEVCTLLSCAVLVEFQALCASGVGFSADGKGESDIMLHVWSCRQWHDKGWNALHEFYSDFQSLSWHISQKIT